MATGGDPLARITLLLDEAHDGRAGALDEVMAVVYPELMRLAGQRLRRFNSDGATPTLEPAALVNETYLKLIRQRSRYDSRGHFLALSSKLMLRVLIDHERTRGRSKRGGDLVRVSFSEALDVADGALAPSMEAFSEALEALEKLDGRSAEIVKARVLWGLTVEEVAESFGLSTRTVERDWKFAVRWLERSMTGAEA